MALTDDYLPSSTNSEQAKVKLPKSLAMIGQGGASAPSSPSLPAALAAIAPQQNPADLPQTGIIPSVKRGAAGTFGSLANLVGAEEMAADAHEWAAKYPKEIPDIQSVKSLSDLGSYAVESAAENTANLLAILGAGAVTVATGGSFLYGAAGANLLLQAGESKAAVQEEGGDVNLLSVGAPALVNTAIDTFSFLKIAKSAGVLSKVMKHVEDAQVVSGLGGRLAAGAKAGVGAVAMEGTTEVVQNYNNLVAAKLANDKEIQEAIALTGKNVHDLIDAFAAGGLGAGVTAAPIATVMAKTEATSETGTAPARTAPTQPTERDPESNTTAAPAPAPTSNTPVVEAPPISTQAAGQVTEPTEVMEPNAAVSVLQAQTAQAIADLEAAPEAPYPRDAVNSMGTFISPNARMSSGNAPGYNQLSASDLSLQVQGIDGTVADVNTTMRPDVNSTFISPSGQMMGAPVNDVDVAAVVASTVEKLRVQYIPEMSVVLGKLPGFGKGSAQANGYQANIKNDQGQSSINIVINPVRIEEHLRNAGITNPEATRAYVAEVTAHEMGHAVSGVHLDNQTSKIQKAVYSDYNTWLSKLQGMTLRQFLASKAAGMRTKIYEGQLSDDLLDSPLFDAANRIGWTGKKLEYQLSFEEFFADMFSRITLQDKSLRDETTPESRTFWKQVYEIFNKVWKDLKTDFVGMDNISSFMKKLRTENMNAMLQTIPVESNTIPVDIQELFPNEIKSLTATTNYPIHDGSRAQAVAAAMGFSKEEQAALQNHYRVSTGFTRKIAGIFLTPSQIAERYGATIPATREYMNEVNKFYNTKMKGISAADAVSKLWMDLPQAQADRLGNFIYAVSELSDKEGRKLNAAEMQFLREKYEVNTHMANIYQDMENTFSEVLGRLETSLVKDIARQFTPNYQAFTDAYMQATDPLVRTNLIIDAGITRVGEMSTQLGDINRAFRQLKDRNYFPRMRFGSYTITVKTTTENANGKRTTSVTEFLTYETKGERDKAMKEYQSDYKNNTDVQVIASKLDDTTRSLYGMPQLVVDRITKAMSQNEKGLTPEQGEALRNISLDLSPGKRYLRHMQKRKNTAGFSTEAMRTYAAYMSNASNHLARVEHTEDMVAQLRALREAKANMQGDLTDLAELESYYTDHFKYLLNPENDWAQLRAFGFLWYLGFNPKSAIVNLTQMPMVTYPYLAARYGDATTVSAMAKGMKDTVAHYRDKKGLPEPEQRLLDRLTQEGVIDESMASDLAGLSEGTALSRIMPTNRAHRLINNVNYYGAAMFGIAEKFNRQATALATFRLHMKESGDFEASFAAAKDAIHKSQFEYAKYNRPEFMRGKKSAFFLFYNYTQQFMYLAFSGARTTEARGTAFRMWAMLFLLAGVQGLPFAEYILSTLDLLGTKLKRWTGMENPKVNLRADLRELFEDIGANPDLMMHGTGRYMGAGPLKLLEMFGAPIPNLDITGSISMGEPLPGLRTNDLRGDPDQMAGQLLLNGLGPIPNIALSAWQGMTSTDPDTWRNMEKAMPVAMKSVSKASRFATRGMETSRGGAEFLPYDGENPYEAGEIVGQLLGFTATRLSQKREMFGEQMNTALYWTERRQLMLERYAYAVKTDDRNAKREAMLDIKAYNAALTSSELKPYRINRTTLKRSLKSKMRTLRKREKGLPTNKKDRLIYEEVKELYDNE